MEFVVSTAYNNLQLKLLILGQNLSFVAMMCSDSSVADAMIERAQTPDTTSLPSMG